MSEGYDEELEALKRKKLLEMQRKLEEERQRRIQMEAILRKIMTPEARSRLANLRLVKPELADLVEQQIIALAQAGRIPIPVTDELLKKILAQLYEQTHRETRIRIRDRFI